MEKIKQIIKDEYIHARNNMNRLKENTGEEKKIIEDLETYSIQVWCLNCGYGNLLPRYVEIPLGVKFTHWKLHNDCPVCGCRELNKK